MVDELWPGAEFTFRGDKFKDRGKSKATEIVLTIRLCQVSPKKDKKGREQIQG